MQEVPLVLVDSSVGSATTSLRQATTLPRPLRTTGVGWLTAAVVLVVLSVLVFAGELGGAAVAVTVVDDAIVGWLAGLRAPGLLGTMELVAAGVVGGHHGAAVGAAVGPVDLGGARGSCWSW